MKKGILVSIITGFLGVMIVGASGMNVDAAEIKLSYSTHFPAQHAQCKAAVDWANEIEKRTGGKVKISVFPGGTLTQLPHLYDGVVKGISDIGFGIFAISRGRFPVMAALDLPVGYPTGMVATRTVHEFAKAVKPKELEDVKVLYLHAHGPGVLFTKKPVRTLEDVKGMKIRATGTSARVVEALGGVPVALPIGGTYEALQKNIAEGNFAAMEALKGFKLAEVVKYVTKLSSVGYTTTFFVVMNKEKWNALPGDIQKVFEQVSEEWVAVHGKIWDDTDEEGISFAKSKGNEIIEQSEAESEKWTQAVASVIKDYIAKTPDGDGPVEKINALIKQNTK